jgi:hypothetical protein
VLALDIILGLKEGGRVKKVDSVVLLVPTIWLTNLKNPLKVLCKVRDFTFFSDYIYDKGNITEVIAN